MKRIWIYTILILCVQTLLSQDHIIQLWPDGVPGAIEDPEYIEGPGDRDPTHIRNVTIPTLSVYLPPAEKANGTAVVICPGGGYWILAFEHEGTLVAEWLNSLGVAGIILKYRLPDERIMEDISIGPLQDVQKAIRTVRLKAPDWNINPQKIGVMGFSAGGHLAATASTLYDDPVYQPVDSISARPDFSVLMYPVISFREGIAHMGSRNRLVGDSPTEAQIHDYSTDEQITSDTPPAFLIHSIDDGSVPIENSLRYFEALRKNNVPCEMHLFESGGHGYGITKGKGSESSWPDVMARWLKMHGWL
ncbi:alpha/beta hydrolase [candidate division KSB1 bacterium]|nr:alpha/beta hydrolase [candidate division KSB1 bacterium]